MGKSRLLDKAKEEPYLSAEQEEQSSRHGSRDPDIN